MSRSLQDPAIRLFQAVEPGDVDALLNARDQFTDEDWEILKQSMDVIKAFREAWQRVILFDNPVETKIVFLDEEDHGISGLEFSICVPKAQEEKQAKTLTGTIHIDGLAISVRQDEKGVTIEVLRRQDLEYLGSIWVWQEAGGTRLTFDGQGHFDTLIPPYNQGDNQ